MAAMPSLALRHALRSSEPCFRQVQRRWATVHDTRCLATHQAPDRYIEKYRAKLEQKAKEVGVKSISELKQVYREKNSKAGIQSTSPFPPPPPPPRIPVERHTASSSSPPPQTPSSIPKPGIKTLSSYLDIPKTLTLPPTEISALWRLRHASSPQSLCATIPLPVFQRMEALAKKHPQFILPLPKPGTTVDEAVAEAAPPPAAEIHFLQWTFPAPDTVTVLFTHLAEYKLRGEYSTPHTTVTHHLELAQDKGLVLLQGVVMEGRGVSVEEGRWLVMCLQRFYGGVGDEREGQARKEMLRMFSEGDEAFRVEALVEETEKLV